MDGFVGGKETEKRHIFYLRPFRILAPGFCIMTHFCILWRYELLVEFENALKIPFC